ncbi:MAG: heme exporter protein CcmB [Candidatus Fervidibacter sp.]|uniref:heme exporter protein CcmB n=1 Tax=Candidatus Fervidibacter sp. TaxID=3100871 RepID=UPI00404A6586
MASSKSSWAKTVEREEMSVHKRTSLLKQVWAVSRKDFQSEWRTRHSLVTTLAFALIALMVVSLSVGSLRNEPALAAGLLWVILFFASINALGRTFTKEVDAHTENLLRLNAEPTSIFLGKTVFNLALLVTVALLTLPSFIALMGLTVKHLTVFVLAVVLTLIAMAALGTILGAMLAKVQSRISLLAVAAFPLFFPALASALQITTEVFGASPESSGALKALFAYAAASVLGGILLFEEVW